MIEDRFLTRQFQYFCETEKRWVTKFQRVPVQIRFMEGSFDETGGRWQLEPRIPKHMHAASDDGSDACADCGLDLRNEVHLRIART